MLIVMSDLHLAESQTNRLGEGTYNLNLPALVYSNYFKEITGLIRQNQVKEIDLVLAGDIFEMTRSGFWLKDECRPYADLSEIETGSKLESRILEILDAIEDDPRTGKTLQVFKSLEDIFKIPVQLHFIPGNHDRLANSTPAVIAKVRSMLGMTDNGNRFDNQYIYYSQNEALALVRHGHEYDPVNFSIDMNQLLEIPLNLPKEEYDKPNAGDFVVVEVASRLPLFFKEHYSEEKILNDTHLLMLYQRLIEFDNVRPASALLNYLFATPGIPMKETWKILEPVFVKILIDLSQKREALDNFVAHYKKQSLGAVFIASLLKMKFWYQRIPYWFILLMMKVITRNLKVKDARQMTTKEAFFKNENNTIRCLIFGHTHVPAVEILAIKHGHEIYSINSGTWRMQIPASPDFSEFGRLRSLTKVLIFGADEVNPEYEGNLSWSFDFNSEIGYGAEQGFQDLK